MPNITCSDGQTDKPHAKHSYTDRQTQDTRPTNRQTQCQTKATHKATHNILNGIIFVYILKS